MPLEDNKDEDNSAEIGLGKTVQTIEFSGPNEILKMNKYHLLYVIKKLQEKPKGPRFEHVMIPAGILLATLLTLLPADFQDYFGIEAATWQALALLICVAASIATIYLFIWWLACTLKRKEKTPLEIYEDILIEMAEDKRKLDAISRRQGIGMENSQPE